MPYKKIIPLKFSNFPKKKGLTLFEKHYPYQFGDNYYFWAVKPILDKDNMVNIDQTLDEITISVEKDAYRTAFFMAKINTRKGECILSLDKAPEQTNIDNASNSTCILTKKPYEKGTFFGEYYEVKLKISKKDWDQSHSKIRTSRTIRVTRNEGDITGTAHAENILKAIYKIPFSPVVKKGYILAFDLGTCAFSIAYFSTEDSGKINLIQSRDRKELIEEHVYLAPSLLKINRKLNSEFSVEDLAPMIKKSDLRNFDSNDIIRNIKNLLRFTTVHLNEDNEVDTMRILQHAYLVLLGLKGNQPEQGATIESILTKYSHLITKICFAVPNTLISKGMDTILKNLADSIKIKYSMNALSQNYQFVSESDAVLANYISLYSNQINKRKIERIIIFDVGAGTSDLTVAELKMNEFNYIIENSANISSSFAGNYFDFIIAEFCFALRKHIDSSSLGTEQDWTPIKYSPKEYFTQIEKNEGEDNDDSINLTSLSYTLLNVARNLKTNKNHETLNFMLDLFPDKIISKIHNAKSFLPGLLANLNNFRKLVLLKIRNSSDLSGRIKNSGNSGSNNAELKKLRKITTEIKRSNQMIEAIIDLKNKIKYLSVGQLEKVINLANSNTKNISPKKTLLVLSGRGARWSLFQKELLIYCQEKGIIVSGILGKEYNVKINNKNDKPLKFLKTNEDWNEKFSVVEGVCNHINWNFNNNSHQIKPVTTPLLNYYLKFGASVNTPEFIVPLYYRNKKYLCLAQKFMKENVKGNTNHFDFFTSPDFLLNENNDIIDIDINNEIEYKRLCYDHKDQALKMQKIQIVHYSSDLYEIKSFEFGKDKECHNLSCKFLKDSDLVGIFPPDNIIFKEQQPVEFVHSHWPHQTMLS